MTVVQKSAIADYLVTFFVDKHISTRMLSELVKHRDDVTYVKALGLPQKFYSTILFGRRARKSYL